MNIFKHITKIIFSTLFITISVTTGYSQWTIPVEYKLINSDMVLAKESISKGYELYQKNCKSCHGEPGKGNFLPLTPPPTDFATPAFQNNRTPGEIFYQITTGKGGMPSFEKTIEEDDRWNLVQYLKSFGENQETVKVEKVNLRINIDSLKKIVTVHVTKKDETGKVVDAFGIKLNFFVKRYFGNMLIQENVHSNLNGMASFKFPENIPGDSLGNLTMITKFASENLYGDTAIVMELKKMGVPVHFKNPLDENSMWGNAKHTPTWLLMSYILVVCGVWSVIFYVVFQILKLKKAGKLVKK